MKKVKKDSGAVKRPEKSKANQAAVQNSPSTDFRSWIGLAAKGPANPNPRFTNEDQLWEKDGD
jgi:hypothetical protein